MKLKREKRMKKKTILGIILILIISFLLLFVTIFFVTKFLDSIFVKKDREIFQIIQEEAEQYVLNKYQDTIDINENMIKNISTDYQTPLGGIDSNQYEVYTNLGYVVIVELNDEKDTVLNIYDNKQSETIVKDFIKYINIFSENTFIEKLEINDMESEVYNDEAYIFFNAYYEGNIEEFINKNNINIETTILQKQISDNLIASLENLKWNDKNIIIRETDLLEKNDDYYLQVATTKKVVKLDENGKYETSSKMIKQLDEYTQIYLTPYWLYSTSNKNIDVEEINADIQQDRIQYSFRILADDENQESYETFDYYICIRCDKSAYNSENSSIDEINIQEDNESNSPNLSKDDNYYYYIETGFPNHEYAFTLIK